MAIGNLKAPLRSMRYPRALLSPLPRGEHLGKPGDRAAQARILDAALELLVSAREPALRELPAQETGRSE